MKTSVFFLAGMLIAAIVTGQNEELKEIEVTPPAFKGEVPNSINAYIQNRVEYPGIALKHRIQGTVVVGFVVTPEGKLENIEVINSVYYTIDNEVIRVLKSTNRKWTPGKINGKVVAMPNEVSVVFKLYQEDNFRKIAKKYLDKGNQALFVKNQPEKALKHFNRGINFLPNDETLLAVRGLCKYKMGDEVGANRDWDRTKVLANRKNSEIDFNYLTELMKNSGILKDYSELLP
jgi:TonB family protein